MSKQQITVPSHKHLYNEVIDAVREFALKHRTKCVRCPNGVVVGEGWIEIEDAEIIKKIENKQIGTCVQESVAMVFELQHRTGVKWIQGELRSRQTKWREMDDNRGMPIYHCWVELDDKVYDFANGSKIIADRDLYYMYRRVVKSKEVPYEFKQNGENKLVLSHNCERDRKPFYDEIRQKQQRLGYIEPE